MTKGSNRSIFPIGKAAREARRETRRQQASTGVGGSVTPLFPQAKVTVEPLGPPGPPVTPAIKEHVEAINRAALPASLLPPETVETVAPAAGAMTPEQERMASMSDDELWDELMIQQYGEGWKELYPEYKDVGAPWVSDKGSPVMDEKKEMKEVPVTVAKLPANTSPPAPARTPEPRKSVFESIHKEASFKPDHGFPKLTDDQITADPSLMRFIKMLTFMRPHGSNTEEQYIKTYITEPLDNRCADNIHLTKDSFGNRLVRVKYPDGSDPDILFSSHTDTVHHHEGKHVVMLGDGMVFTDTANCLGADDTTGNWLMLEMIEAKVPGLYIFHRGEEKGGLGSGHITRQGNAKEKFKGFKAAIAFDRKGFDSVITRQSCGRCCSDTFAKSLAAIMGGKYQIDTGGTFTDTAKYVDLIGECTNLSVGYFNQHGPREWSDVSFLKGIRDVLIEADWSKLVFERKPGDREAYTGRYGGAAGYTGGYGGYGGYYDYDDDGVYRRNTGTPPTRDTWKDRNKSETKAEAKAAAKDIKTPRLLPPGPLPKWKENQIVQSYGAEKARQAREELKRMLKFVYENPTVAAHFLVEKGYIDGDLFDFYEDWEGNGKMGWDV